MHNAKCCELGVKEGYSANTPALKNTPYSSEVRDKRILENDKNFDNIMRPTIVTNKNRTPRKGSAIPFEEPVLANNGLVYKSNPKHTKGYGCSGTIKLHTK